MATEGEQAQPKRRASRDLRITDTNAAEYPDPINLTPKRGVERATGAPNPNTQYDEGYEDHRRPNSNVMRPRATTTSIPQQRTPQPQPAAGTPRQTLTRDLPRQSRQVRTVNLPLAEPPAKPSKAHILTNKHWLVPVGIGMAVALVLWLLGSLALGLWNQVYNNIEYGNPRTWQTDAVVGHGDSTAHPSHFIAMNWNHQAVVIELKGGDPSKMVSYTAPVYIGGDNGQAPVTLQFRDVTGDGKVDMIIHIHVPGQDLISVFINQGDSFRPATPSDHIHLQ